MGLEKKSNVGMLSEQSKGGSVDVLRKGEMPCFLACGPAMVVKVVLRRGTLVTEVRLSFDGQLMIR